MSSANEADKIIETLQLLPHPEGGWFRETFRDQPAAGRGFSTAIYYLLKAGERSHWHRVDAAEVWHWYGGSPLALDVSSTDGPARELVLGNDVLAGQQPQLVVQPGEWQAAHSLGDWTLVGCTVAPAFQFEGFEMAPGGWQPGQPLLSDQAT